MLSLTRYIFMTGKAKSIFKGLQLDGRTVYPVTVIAFTIPDRWVYHLPQQPRITGAMLGMAVNTPVFNRVIAVGRYEGSLGKIMTAGA